MCTRKTLAGSIAIALVMLGGCSIKTVSKDDLSQLDALRTENQQLREHLQMAVGHQMREIIVAGVRFANAHDRFPARPSELRDIVGEHNWQIFIAPYDRSSDVIRKVAAMEDAWAWIDDHASFQWLEGELFNSHSPALIQRRGELGQPRWVFFGDAHGEQLACGGSAWQEFGLP